jgi:LPS sulfotransferase NodH
VDCLDIFGIESESSTGNVTIDTPRFLLQRFLVSLMNSGVLICICGSGDAGKIKAQLRYASDMPLKLDFITSMIVNNRRKSDNLLELSNELNTPLESFALLSGNPADCAEVRERLPAVQTIPLTQDVNRFSTVLQHSWALDVIADDGEPSSGPGLISVYPIELTTSLITPEQIQSAVADFHRTRKSAAGSSYSEPKTPLEAIIADIWSKVLMVNRVGNNDNFFELGGDSVRAAMVANKLQAILSAPVYIGAIFEHPRVGALAGYLAENYPNETSRLSPQPNNNGHKTQDGISAATENGFRKMLLKSQPKHASRHGARRNARALFVLAPARSGSTLLRVMLGGHPKIFAPPELELLHFTTLDERKDMLGNAKAYCLEGTIRALMQIHSCDATRARELMASYETQRMETQQFYRLLQESVGNALLVDKTVSYTLDLPTLKKIEQFFDEPLYLHLLRHPLSTVNSFISARMDQALWMFSPFTHQPQYSVCQLAELSWLTSHDNILSLLSEIPLDRRITIKYEDFTVQPRRIMTLLCERLGINFDSGMLDPYKDRYARMTDGILADSSSRMLGDPNFHKHNGIEAPEKPLPDSLTWDSLSARTIKMAESFGYDPLPAAQGSSQRTTLGT